MCRAGKPFPCNKLLRKVRGYKGNKTQASRQATLCNILLPVTGLCNARFTKFKRRPVRSSGSRMLWTQPALKRGGTDTGYHSSGPQGPRGLISGCAAPNRAHWARATCDTTRFLRHPPRGVIWRQEQHKCSQPFPKTRGCRDSSMKATHHVRAIHFSKETIKCCVTFDDSLVTFHITAATCLPRLPSWHCVTRLCNSL